MRFNLVGVLRTLASIALRLAVAASALSLMALGSFVVDSLAPSSLDGGFISMFGGPLLAQSLIMGVTSLVTWALLLAVSTGLRTHFAIAENPGAALDQPPGQGDSEPQEDPGS